MKFFRLARGFARQMSRANVNAYAASTAFFIFVSLIPMIMLFCSALSFTPYLTQDLLLDILELFPESLSPFLISIAQSIYDSTFGMLSISAIATVWSAGKGVLALMRGLNAMYGYVEDRNYVIQRLIASLYLVIFLAVVIFLLLVMVFGNQILEMIISLIPGGGDLFSFLLSIRGVFSLCLMALVFALMYTFVPNGRQKFVSQIPGAIFSAVAWFLFSWFFSLYVEYSDGFDMYGSLTTIVIAMLWLYFCSYLFLVGAHINRFLIPYWKLRRSAKHQRTLKNVEHGTIPPAQR